MRHRLPSPIRPFDVTPPYVIESAKRIFSEWWGMGTPMVATDDEPALTDPKW